MHYDLCCIGHITQDKVVTPEATVLMPGGTSFYFSHAIANMNARYLLVTALAATEAGAVTALQQRGVEVLQLPSKHTVYFENIYGYNKDNRSQRVLQQADPFREEDLRSLEASIFHLGPLLASDFSDNVINTLAAKGKISLDVQGLLRRVEDEKVVAIDWETKKEILPLIHFLKASEDEMTVLTGLQDVEQGAKQLADWGAKEVIITMGSKGSAVYADHAFYHIPAYAPSQLQDATGCGDTYMAGYLYQRVKGSTIQDAGEFAAAMATLKLGVNGPFTGTREEVEAIRNMNTIK
ncbi:MAG: ribokinase [Chitinophagaceae bacterium]|nr:MAG: ribokinase [Chitinophagaceae bacterium]